MENINKQFKRLFCELDLTDDQAAMIKKLQRDVEAALRQPPVISCVCPNEIKTGTVSIHCCNLCGKPDQDWWANIYYNVGAVGEVRIINDKLN